jgi:lipopolysaccharide biosynthesis glycosyltransferase
MKINIAFCADKNMEAPLHVASSSILACLNPLCTARFSFIVRDFGPAGELQLLKTLDLVGRPYEAEFLREPDSGIFSGLRPFHGNMMAYYRLLLPEMVDADRCLYVDADTVCFVDVSQLVEFPMDGHSAGFVESGVVSDYPEKRFFDRLGLAPDTPAFNSGVILFNIPEWKKQDRTQQVLKFCRENPNELIAADQTALIAKFGGNFARLPDKYNRHIYPDFPRHDPIKNPAVYHFVGSPKPWDLAGKLIHPNFELYKHALGKTAVSNQVSSFLRRSSWKRAYRVRGGYFRTLRNRLYSGLGY